jgi:hypothetical protein
LLDALCEEWSLKQHRCAYKAFATFLESSIEAALQALIDSKDRDQAEALLGRFRDHEINERRKAKGSTATYVSTMRAAVRTLRAKGFTSLDIDRRFEEYAPGSIRARIADGVGPEYFRWLLLLLSGED